jgi:DNA-binding cell septation regulator SpoVG
MPPKITNVRFSAAAPELARGGLLGFISCVVNGSFCVDGIALRRTRDGRRALSFPSRRDRRGREHPILVPIDDETRRAIECQVFEALGAEDGRR